MTPTHTALKCQNTAERPALESLYAEVAVESRGAHGNVTRDDIGDVIPLVAVIALIASELCMCGKDAV